MKKRIILFLFCSMSLTFVFAQKNELNFEYAFFLNEKTFPGGAVAYYRHVTPKMALGSRLTYITDNHKLVFDNSYWQVDLVTKIKTLAFQKFHLNMEPGVSFIRKAEEQFNFPLEDPFGPIVDSYVYPSEKKLNYLGFTSGIILDYLIDKTYGFGVNFRFNYLISTDEEVVDRYFFNFYPNFNFHYLF